MTVIRIDPAEVSETGRKFFSTEQDVNGLVTQARSMMSTLRGQFTGLRATKIFNEWDGMQASLNAAMESLRNAGTLLNSAANDFSQADRM